MAIPAAQSVARLPYGLLLLTKLKKVTNFASLHRINLTWFWRQLTYALPALAQVFSACSTSNFGERFCSKEYFFFQYRQGQKGVKIRLEFLGFNINCFFTGLKYIDMNDLVNCSYCGETFHILSKSDPRLEQHLKYVKKGKIVTLIP